MYKLLNIEELFLVQSFSHESKNAFIKDISSSIPLIQDPELSKKCKRLLLKVNDMTNEEFDFNNIPLENTEEIFCQHTPQLKQGACRNTDSLSCSERWKHSLS